MFHRFRRKKVKPLEVPNITEALPPSPHQQQVESFPNAPDIRRNATSISNLSSYAIITDRGRDDSAEERRREQSAERHADPLGLNVIYQPYGGVPTANIIFVHGLGGTSQKTWCRNRDIRFFWPREWLPLETGFGKIRVLSFGYNAHFASCGRENILNIGDFAKDLLFGMKFGLDQGSQELEIGKAPIIFVAHSMGGLVVKKAFILAQNDNQYRQVLTSACAILFLSTPHRGTNLAELLNRILSVSVFNHSAKQYIAELRQNSPALQDINEQFRNIASHLRIFSFFETQQTAIGPKKMMVLEKDSSILGYPDEVSKPLDADHHNVCKFASQQDPNYVSVRNALKSLLRRMRDSDPGINPPVVNQVDMSKVQHVLAVSGNPEDDYEYFRSRWMRGSCEWIFLRPVFLSWLEDCSDRSRILWVHGVPGCGKSILSSFVIEQLQEKGYSCQYFFFRFGDSAKRTVNLLLRSIAYQLAVELPELRAHLQMLAQDSVKLEKAEGRIIWQKVFITKLSKLQIRKPLFWIIDALDECEAPQLLLNLLSSLSSFQSSLRIMFVGRKTETLSAAFQRIEASVSVDTLAADEAKEDLESYVAREVHFMRGDSQFKTRVIRKICRMAHSNFLWVHLVLKEILQCHTEAAVEMALEELPADLEPLYHRMENALSKTTRASDRKLSKTILTWIVCSQRALTLEELSEVLKPEFSHVLDLRLTISQVCGDFVVIDSKSRVGMVHQTAREYLVKTPGLEHSITPRAGHRELFTKCISCLSVPTRRTRIAVPLTQPFLHYAATTWPFHLGLSTISSDHSTLLVLVQFFQGPYLFSWIHLLAAIDSLRSLVYASKSLISYLGAKSKIDAESSPLTHPLQEKELLELWAMDLVKIVGKFGAQLVNHPRSIYSLIPDFSPTKTMIAQQGRRNRSGSPLVVTGFNLQQWDDCLSKFLIGRDCQSLRVICIYQHFVIMTSDGTLRLYDTLTSQLWHKIVHGERILSFKFSASYEKCATYGFRETKVWSVKERRQLHSVQNPINAKALDVTFSSDESAILTCSDDKQIRRCLLSSSEQVWQIVDGNQGFDNADGKVYNSPRRVSFNPTGTQVAVAFRGFPLLVWDLEIADILGRCERASDRNRGRQHLYSEIGPICWNPVTGHVLGLYKDGCIFKWHPLESLSQEFRTVETAISCSAEGALFATSNSEGILKVWDFHHLTLVYQLSCHTPVIDLAMSPDGRRVYDLRESFCNVWEPNALIRLAEADENSSDTLSTLAGSTQVSLASDGPTEFSEPLTALAIGPKTGRYCSGDDIGIVRVSESHDQVVTQISQGFMPVDHVVWSDDERYLATADLGGRLNVRLRNPSTHPTSADEYSLSMEAKTGNGLRQLLFSQDSGYLLVATIAFAELWFLKTKTLIVTRPKITPYTHWINHPIESHTLIECTSTEFHIYRWSDLAEIACYRFAQEPYQIKHQQEADQFRRPSASHPMSPDENHDAVDEVFVSSNGSHVLVHTSLPSAQRSRTRQYQAINSVDLAAQDSTKSVQIRAREILGTMATDMGKVLGFVRQSPRRTSYGILDEVQPDVEDALVFLDRDDWVCSFIFGGDTLVGSKIRRHFFLPQDWLNTDSLKLATVSSDGRLYCPRNGEVAIVNNWVQNEWVD
ncbi:MAG: hypothetical protein Q9196_002137 [Gyalolechia fulgens]